MVLKKQMALKRLFFSNSKNVKMAIFFQKPQKLPSSWGLRPHTLDRGTQSCSGWLCTLLKKFNFGFKLYSLAKSWLRAWSNSNQRY